MYLPAVGIADLTGVVTSSHAVAARGLARLTTRLSTR